VAKPCLCLLVCWLRIELLTIFCSLLKKIAKSFAKLKTQSIDKIERFVNVSRYYSFVREIYSRGKSSKDQTGGPRGLQGDVVYVS
jgi:hypothetical protein